MTIDKDGRRRMVCIVCPKGCRLTAEPEGDGWRVTGNACSRGRDYAQAECTHPTRMLTTTVEVAGGMHARLPVKTAAPIPKELLEAAMAALSRIRLEAPVYPGQVILPDLLGTGVDVIATRGMERIK